MKRALPLIAVVAILLGFLAGVRFGASRPLRAELPPVDPALYAVPQAAREEVPEPAPIAPAPAVAAPVRPAAAVEESAPAPAASASKKSDRGPKPGEALTGTIRGSVQDTAYRGIADATVLVYRLPDEASKDGVERPRSTRPARRDAGPNPPKDLAVAASTQTDKRGDFRFDKLPRPARYVLRVDGAYVAPAEVVVTLVDERGEHVELRSEPAGAIDLRLLEKTPDDGTAGAAPHEIQVPGGKAGAAVVATRAGDAGGKIVIGFRAGKAGAGTEPRVFIGGLVPGSYRLDIRVRGYRRAQVECRVGSPRAEEPVVATLERGVPVEGYISSLEGPALQDASVVFADEEGSAFEPVAESLTDPIGRFRLEGLDPGRLNVLRVRHKAWHALDLNVHAPLAGLAGPVYERLTVRATPPAEGDK